MTNVLIKALMAFKTSQKEFQTLRSVIHAAWRGKVVGSGELANLLEGVDLFWKLVKNKDLNLKSVAGFKDRIRKYILSILQCAYHRFEIEIGKGIGRRQRYTRAGVDD